ncbi:hypothetical protein SELMODRAFT_132012 [Selaginella moellendorffii]|uniref:Uncharacterized protein n=1 Tax=Selaginella moellendorffii TaxID=88036 RepID=D8T4W5_SELML|nr:hypothetical protein SELMODRAFT_132012 [Selaginella moellendorffii]
MESSDLRQRLLPGDEVRRKNLNHSAGESITPYASAGLASRAFFLWLNPVLALGYKAPLEPADIPALAPEDGSREACNQLSRAWDFERRRRGIDGASLSSALARCYWKEMAAAGVFAFLKSVTLSVGPLVLNSFIAFANGRVLFKGEGYVLVAALFLAKMVESISQRHWYFASRRVGMRARAALIGAIYEKELKLSNLGRQSHAAGEIVNYMAVDAYRVGEFPYWFHMAWTVPLQIFIAMGIIYFSVGLATFAGLAVIFLTMFLNGPVVRIQQKCQAMLMAAQDERLRATSEALRNMKILKLQAWEDKFMAAIQNLRDAEFQWIRGVQYRRTLNSIFFWVSPILVTTSTFVAAYLLGIPLSASNVFTALATLRIIQESIRLVPDVISAFVNVRVSLARISRFLGEDELDPSIVSRSSSRDNEVAVRIEHADFDWDSDELIPTLKDITLTVKRGEKLAVCGEVGSGKSTLLHAILGELPKLRGTIHVSGSVAYVAQSAWIQSGTIRDNILFGLPLENDRYIMTLRACALDKDLENLQFGDLTEIGERGLNVSGGQKQRIQLARAIYQDADVYLLDDPFSAVDAQTGALLLKNCILGALSAKTIILVTHQVDFLPIFDSILLLHDGEIHSFGKYEDLLKESELFQDLVGAHKDVMGTRAQGPEKRVLDRRLSSKNSQKRKHDQEQVADRIKGDQLIKLEEVERGDTGMRPYIYYLGQANGFLYIGLAVLVYLVFTGGQLSSNWWMASHVGNPNVSAGRLVGIYAAIGLSTVPFVNLRSLFTVTMGLEASKSFFSELTASLFRAPMSFFDSTPTGRILSRLSVDLSILDVDIPFSMQIAMSATLNAYSSLAVTAAVTWQILIVVIPVIYISRRLQLYYLASARDLMRIHGTTKSPLASYLQETIAGASTIRSYCKEKLFMEKMLQLVDDNSGPAFYSNAANEWLIQRLETLWSLIVCCSALVMVILPSAIFVTGFAGLAISYGLSLNVAQVISVQNQCNLANFIVSVERIKQYLHLPREEPQTNILNEPPASWPDCGKIELQNLQIRYVPGSPLVLKGISCTFEGGQRVGIVGRTGSGKTTLISALFRLVEPAGGTIVIDGVDITKVPLKVLRSRLSIIPQEPTLFRGTVRFNVDPLEEHPDTLIWEVLEKCHLRESIKEKPGKLSSLVGDDGENWSVGQRQLFCLARALLKKSRILVLDEATASIDNATDAILQKLLREEFSDCTVITVAHRIPTVIDSDMVLALRDGKLVNLFDVPEKLLNDRTSLFAKLVAEYWSSAQQNH